MEVSISICNSLIELNLLTARRRHVFGDLYPYVCTIQSCRMELRPKTGQFSNSSYEWARHELSHRPSSWSEDTCPFCPDHVMLESRTSYFKHVSKHLREISLTTLPLPEEDEEDGSAASGSTINDYVSENKCSPLQGTPDNNANNLEAEDHGSKPEGMDFGTEPPYASQSRAAIDSVNTIKGYRINHHPSKATAVYSWYCVRESLPIIPQSSKLTVTVSM